MNKVMTNAEMVQAVNGLGEFVKKDKVVPISLSVAISANIKSLTRELEPYEEQRVKLVEAKDLSAEDLNNRFKELCNLDAEVPIRTVKQDIIDELELSTKDYMTLEFMIEQTEPESQSE